MRTSSKTLVCLCTALFLPALAIADPEPETANASAVQGFATALYLHHNVKQAFNTYASLQMIQHNPAAKDGRAAAIALCTPLFETPGASFGVEQVIMDGDMAFIHFRGLLGAGNRGAAVAELYRLQDGKLVEHWDAFQPIPPTAKNAHPMFGTIAAGIPATAYGASAEERHMVERFAALFYTQRNVPAAFERFVAPGYVQHNPGVADGRDAAIAALTPLFSRRDAHFEIRHILVGGAYAVIHLHAWMGTDPGAAVFDIYRLEHGKIVEHWDVLQPLAAKSPNPRPAT
jgi:predicted SnoaL-like aldol condensation-catalyzing enzyme